MDLHEKIRLAGFQSARDFAKSINLPKTRLDAILSGDLSKRADVAKVEKSLGIHLIKQQKPILKPLIGVNPSKPNKPHSAKYQSCVECGADDGTIQNCHYTGFRQHAFEKGLGLKGDHEATAEFCHKCHAYFDQPKNRKSIEASRRFLAGIIKTQTRRHIIDFVPNLSGMDEEAAEAYLFGIVQLIVAAAKRSKKSY